MKQQLAVFCLLISLNNGFAQEDGSTKKYSLKVYNLMSYENTGGEFHESTEFNIIKPSFAFQWKTKKMIYHEIELINFQVNKHHHSDKDMQTGNVNYDYKFFKTDVSLRYELIFSLNKTEGKKLMPAIGIGINPYFFQVKSTPLTPNTFNNTITYTGAGLYLIPRLVYNISEKLYLDFNIPVMLSNNNIEINKVENPSFNINQRRTTTSNSNQFPAYYSGRIGLGVRI